MFDKEETLHLLELIETTLSTIEERCKKIVTVDDFLLSDQGMILMDNEQDYKNSNSNVLASPSPKV